MTASRRFGSSFSFVLARGPLALLLTYATACEHEASKTGLSPPEAAVIAPAVGEPADAEVSADGAATASAVDDTSGDAGRADSGVSDAAASDAATATGGASSAGELALLSRARRMVRKSPARALTITIDHQRRFKQPHHAELREVVAIEALVRLSRPAEARARARAFFIAYPQARDGARVRMLLDHNGD